MIYVILALLLVGCATAPTVTPTLPPDAFPTMTPGRVVRAPLPTPIPADPNALNPGQAAALLPTVTPNRAACPTNLSTGAVMPSDPAVSPAAISAQIAAFLTSGGSPAETEATLRQRGWIGGAGGFVRAELDLTGEGIAEVVAAFRAEDPGPVGVLALFSCADGAVVPVYQFVTDAGVPQIVSTNDLNADVRPDLLFTAQRCADDGACRYFSQIASWSAGRGDFVNLLAGEVDSESLPTVEDYDNDRVLELVVRQEDDGTAATGPLRTGFTVYDWDGVLYVRSITQLNPPRYLVQVIQQADAAFDQGQLLEAVGLYTLALGDDGLDDWQPNDREVLRAYALYRQLVAYAALGDPRASDVAAAARAAYPNPALAPVYMTLLEAFWSVYSTNPTAASACAAVNVIIPERPESVDLLNRYGSASPVYSGADVCPF